MRVFVLVFVALSSCFFSCVNAALADENPQPLWSPLDWDSRHWANNGLSTHLSLFLHARDARRYCVPHDEVVWLDRSSGLFYTGDRRQYHEAVGGKGGYFVCRHQALSVGAQAAQ